MQNFEIEFYELPDGQIPVQQFLSSLDLQMRAKAIKTIQLLENNGNELREPYSKHVENGIFELRIKHGTDISRILHFFVIDKKIILTNGFMKKTSKTPKAEIDKAHKFKDDYINNANNINGSNKAK